MYAGLLPLPVGWHSATTLWVAVIITFTASSCPVRHWLNLEGNPQSCGDGIIRHTYCSKPVSPCQNLISTKLDSTTMQWCIRLRLLHPY